jgi:hypothetical protein
VASQQHSVSLEPEGITGDNHASCSDAGKELSAADLHAGGN